jgi:nucleolar protein 56
MNARNPPERGWFVGLDPDDDEEPPDAIRRGHASEPEEWPTRAVEMGVVADEAEYYDRLREATIAAARAEVTERERADDKQLAHAIRALDDCERTANELLERVAEWAGTHDEGASVDIEYARELADTDAEDPVDRQLSSLAQRVCDLTEEADSLRTFVERSGPEVAPNLSALAGPLLAARLIALAGGLEALAKKPAGTVQVLGAEDALFAHLRGNAPSPKHGIIYTHDAVSGTAPAERGSAARAVAGKLAIAARIDHYSGDYRPELEADLADRMERIRARDSA